MVWQLSTVAIDSLIAAVVVVLRVLPPFISLHLYVSIALRNTTHNFARSRSHRVCLIVMLMISMRTQRVNTWLLLCVCAVISLLCPRAERQDRLQCRVLRWQCACSLAHLNTLIRSRSLCLLLLFTGSRIQTVVALKRRACSRHSRTKLRRPSRIRRQCYC